MRKRAWALVRRQTAEDWRDLLEMSDVIRSVLEFDEMRDPETGCVFYMDTTKKDSTGVFCRWKKPDKVLNYEKKVRGIAIASNPTFEDSGDLRDRSKLLRTIGPWQEFADTKLGLTFYFNDDTEQQLFSKPSSCRRMTR